MILFLNIENNVIILLENIYLYIINISYLIFLSFSIHYIIKSLLSIIVRPLVLLRMGFKPRPNVCVSGLCPAPAHYKVQLYIYMCVCMFVIKL